MASNTKKTQSIRKRHSRTRGKENRRARRSKGTTPPFSIHVEQAPKVEAAS